jgi:hypothetical protein
MRVSVRPTTVMKDERDELPPVVMVPPVPPSPPIPPIPPDAELEVVAPLEADALPPVPPAAPPLPLEVFPPVVALKPSELATLPVLVFETAMTSLLPTYVRV